MAVYEKNGLLTYKDGNGNKNLLYPVTKLECVDGAEVLAETSYVDAEVAKKANASHSHNNYASTVTTTGSGNAVTAITQSGNTITATKGATFLTAHPTITKSTDTTNTATPAFGGTFTAIDSVTRDGNGHVTKVNTKTVTVPNTAVTTTTAGLMSAADKVKLNGIATGANAYSHPTYTARTGVPTANQTPAFGGTFSVSQPVSDGTGHITAINSRTITIPKTEASTSAAGLMSAADKKKLDGIAEGANNYTYTLPTATSSVLGGVKTGSNITNSNGTISLTKANVTSALGYTPPTQDTTYSVASTSANGLMSSTDKSKLDGIAAGANAYTHPSYTSKSSGLYKITVDSTGHVSGTAAVAKSDITALGIPASDTTYSAATTSAAGLMSAADKSKLDGIATGANKITVDSSLSSSSTNPVQNKAVNSAISTLTNSVNSKADAGHSHSNYASTVTTTGSGNAITAISQSGNTITATKGATFATSDHGHDAITTAQIDALFEE